MSPNEFRHDFDAEGVEAGDPCPECGSDATITFHYREGFTELECRACGYRSDAEELAALQRYAGDLLERDDDPASDTPPVPRLGKLDA